ncbi:MAG: major facilitator superfamily transporter [Bacteroidetes bacterium HLUCCA01]|nr:MAG: major facilitator superfamily transporter [Bacteroidetes bacterium HLUCCA01]
MKLFNPPQGQPVERPGLILFALWLLIFSASSQIIIIAPILPVIGIQLNMPEALQGVLVTSYAVMVGIFALIIGPISDKIGRRRVLLIGTLSMAIALSLHGLAQTWQQLLFMRALAGVAGGLLSGSAVSYVGDYFPVERRGWATGWIMSGAATGQIVGIPLGTVMAEFFGFRIPFLMFGLTMFATWFLVARYVPQPPVRLNRMPITVSGSIRAYVQLLKRPKILAATGSFFLMFISVGLFIVYFPTWLQHSFDVNGTYIASLFLVGGVANVILGPRAGALSDKIGRKALVMISCLITSLVFAATTFAIVAPWIGYPFIFIVMSLVAMRVSPFQALLTELVTDEKRGSLLSLNAALGQAGLGLGGAVAGVLYTIQGYASNTILSGITILVTGLIIWRYVPESAHFRKQKVLQRQKLRKDSILGE